MNGRAGTVAVLAATGVIATVPRLVRRMAGEFESRGALTPATTCWMYAGYAAHATLYAGALVRRGRRATAASWGAGGAAMAAGGLLCVSGMTRFSGPGQLSGTRDGAFVTDGVYALTRNPQYLGYVALLAGGAVTRRSVPGAVLTCGAGAVLDRWVPVEERLLSRRHGAAYDDYAARTPRWLDLSVPPFGRRDGQVRAQSVRSAT